MFKRFAIYALPAAEDPLFLLASRWLGWDSVHAQQFEPPMGLARQDWDLLTDRPRKYGFHGTLRPPMMLAEGKSRDDMDSVMGEVAQRQKSFHAGLKLTNLNGFFALTLTDHHDEMGKLGQDVVLSTDKLRAAPKPKELERRRAPGLTERQEELLLAHGYPHVLDEFHFHMTLSGPIDQEIRDEVAGWIGMHLPMGALVLKMDRLSLLGEDGAGMFHVLSSARLAV